MSIEPSLPPPRRRRRMNAHAPSRGLSAERAEARASGVLASGEFRAPEGWRALRRPLAHALGMFAATRAALVIAAICARATFGPLHGPSRATPTGVQWLDAWAAFDVGWYLQIARGGYPTTTAFNAQHQDVYAFFPALPFIARALAPLVGGPYVAGLIVANVALLASACLLHIMVREDHDEETARRAVRYLFLFPSAFIFSAMLTESLFLALALASLLLARRGRWAQVALAAFLLGLTRNTAILIVPALALEARAAGRMDPRALLALLAAPAGLALVMLTNLASTGDALAFLHVQAAWGSPIGTPVRSLLQGALAVDVPPGMDLHARLMTGFALLALAALAWSLRARERLSWVVFGALLVVTPLFRSWYGMPRYVLVAFPLYVALARITAGRPEHDAWLSAAFAILQGVLFALWSNGFEFVV